MGGSISVPAASSSSKRSSIYCKTTSCDDAAAPPPPPLLPPVDSSSDSTNSSSSSSLPPPPPVVVAEVDDISKAAASASASSSSLFPNPGSYEAASMEGGKGIVSLDTHDGFRCDINKQLSPYFATVHSFWLGTNMIPDGRTKTYSFVSQVATEDGLLMARVDPMRGSVDGRVHASLFHGLAMMKLQLGLSGDSSNGSDDKGKEQQPPSQDQALGELDFGGHTWTANLKYGSMAGGLMFGGNYFQSVTRNLALGGEGMYIATNNSLLSSYTLKYSMDNLTSTPTDEDNNYNNNNNNTIKTSSPPPSLLGSAVAVVNYNAAQGLLALNYRRVVTPDRVMLAAELQCSPVTLDSQVLMGGEIRLNKSKVNLCVDGTGKIQSCLETKLGMAPGSPTLTFTAEIDHGKDVMRFGYGLNVGG